MEKAFLTPIVLTRKQEALCEKYAMASRLFFNSALGVWKNRHFRRKAKAWFANKPLKDVKVKYKDPTYTDFKDNFPWMFGSIPAVVLRDAVDNCNTAMKNFFRRVKSGETPGFPRFKSKKKSPISFVNYQGDTVKLKSNNTSHYSEVKFNEDLGWVKLVRDNYIPFFKDKILVGLIGIKKTPKYAGTPIQIAFSKRPDGWYASITLYVPDLKVDLKNREYGVDVGSRTLAAVSNGKKYNPNEAVQLSLEKTEKQLKRWQKIMSRRFIRGAKEQSKGWFEAKEKVQKFNQKLSNSRKDLVDKISHNIVDHDPKRIVIENLNVRGMKSNKRLAPSLQKVGLYRMHQCLIYKSKWRGIKVQQADRWYPSSQLCSCCGNRKFKKELGSNEIYRCNKCGYEENRDVNAAINLVQIPQDKLKDLVSN